jgi:hypothetical protein
MKNIWVCSNDGDNENAGTYDLPKKDLAGASLIADLGDTIYISYLSDSGYTVSKTITLPLKITVISVDEWDREAVSEPTPIYRKGAIEGPTGSASASLEIIGGGDFMGVIFKTGTGAGHIYFNRSGSYNHIVSAFECEFHIAGSYSLYLGPSYRNGYVSIILKNCDYYLGNHANSRIRIQGNVKINGGSVLGYSTPTSVFTREGYSGPDCFIENFDASIFGAGKSLLNMGSTAKKSTFFRNCKIGVGCSLTTGTPNEAGAEAEFVNVSDDYINYDYRFQNALGNIYSEPIIKNNDGADISRKLVSSVEADYFSPLILDNLFIYNDEIENDVSVEIEILTDNITLNIKDLWLEIEYLGDENSPLGFIETLQPDYFSAGENLSLSSADWADDTLGTPVKQLISATINPKMCGPIKVRLCLAKPLTTIYIDPKIKIS